MQSRTIVLLAVLAGLICLVTVAPASASVVYVKWDSPNDGPGNDWDHAYNTIQAGLNTAVAGDEVWVAAGTYVERITLKAGVGLYGGFGGTETQKDQRNWMTNVTILDGNHGGSVVTSPSGATSVTRIDGFMIRNGRADLGGGIYCSSSSPTIANNTISGNTASGYGGGGIYCYHSSPTITNNTISGNTASFYGGGGIYCGGSSPEIRGNIIKENASAIGGGGIRCASSSSPTIANNVFFGNSSGTYGGGIYCWESSPNITHNTIVANTAAVQGGGLHCQTRSFPITSNNIVAFNSSGVHCFELPSAPTLHNNCVFGNGTYDYSGVNRGPSDISVDPMLASKDYGNLHIQPASPCRNAGWNDAPGLPPADMDGQPRVQDGTVDIGADESDGMVWPSEPPVIVRVSPDGNNSNDGSTWPLAKRHVQEAIDATSSVGGEVWVAAGTYNERITLKAYTYVYGGFAGTETQRSQRNWVSNVTILDGQQGGSVVSGTVPGYATSGVDGLTIRNGRSSNGGGIYCSFSSPTISNNTISDNTATSYGGGIYCNYSSPTITNNTISGNSASYGGGIYCYWSSPAISNNTLSDNTATSYGGAIYCLSDIGYMSSPVISNNTITENTANTHGGGIYLVSSSPAISNNIVAFNSSGIYKSGGSPMLRNNDVYGNTSYDYSPGLLPGMGDISADPLFVYRTGGNLHIQLDSPCIDAGRDDAPGLPPTDMDGESRQVDIPGKGATGVLVDIGADEYYSFVMSIADAKRAEDGTVVSVMGAIVIAVFTSLSQP